MESANQPHPNAHLQYHADYGYPPFRKIQLAAVKQGIYHPKLPSLRQMDMDTQNQKLPDEHCRTTTSCGPRDFARASSSLLAGAEKPLSGSGITATGRSLSKAVPAYSAGVTHTQPEKHPYMLSASKGEWSKFISASGEFRLPEYNAKDFRFSGYGVRYLKPDVTQSWRYTLVQEPKLDQFGQRPMPANVFSRYRDTIPQFARNVSVEAWR